MRDRSDVLVCVGRVPDSELRGELRRRGLPERSALQCVRLSVGKRQCSASRHPSDPSRRIPALHVDLLGRLHRVRDAVRKQRVEPLVVHIEMVHRLSEVPFRTSTADICAIGAALWKAALRAQGRWRVFAAGITWVT